MPKWWTMAKTRGSSTPVSVVETAKLQSVLPGTVTNDCDAESLCKAAAVLCVAGVKAIEHWTSVLSPEERAACAVFCDLVARSPLPEVDDLAFALMEGGKTNVGAQAVREEANDGAAKPRVLSDETMLASAVSQVLAGLDSQLSATRESLTKALVDMQTSVLGRMQEMQGQLRHPVSIDDRTPTRSRASSRSRSEPDHEESLRSHSRQEQAPKPQVRRKSCMKKSSSSHNLQTATVQPSADRSETSPVTSAKQQQQRAHVHAHLQSGNLHLECDHFPTEVTEHYQVEDDKLGAGTFGVTRIGRHKETGAERAIKAVPKAMLTEQMDIWREIRIQGSLDHPNIARLFATYEDNKSMYLVMELCSGGELFDAIVDHSVEGFTERNAARLMRQMLGAVAYLHAHKICHRDLKPENFLLSRKADDGEKTVKLIDFGSAKSYANGEELTTKVFTVHYVAPEVLTRQAKPYTEVCDVWSLGVVLFLLLSGRPPFSGKDDMTIMKAIKKGNYSLEPESVWQHVSVDAVQLLKDMLQVQPAKRHSAQTAMHHRWIDEQAPDAIGAALGSSEVLGGLRSFMAQNKLKKFALQVIAQNISDEHIDSLKSIFLAIDTDLIGSLHVDMIEEAIKGLHLEDTAAQDLMKVLQDMAAEGGGMVNYTQFLGATIDRKHYMQEEALKQVFDCFDVDGDGHISKEELAAVLGCDNSNDPEARRYSADATELAQILQTVDADGDGNIDFQEFMDMMSKQN